jgi:hypothetical protein
LARNGHSLPVVPVEPFTRRGQVVFFEQERVEEAATPIGYPATLVYFPAQNSIKLVLGVESSGLRKTARSDGIEVDVGRFC